jgi:hypothetical protein
MAFANVCKANLCLCLNFHILPLSVYLLASQVEPSRLSSDYRKVLCEKFYSQQGSDNSQIFEVEILDTMDI